MCARGLHDTLPAPGNPIVSSRRAVMRGGAALALGLAAGETVWWGAGGDVSAVEVDPDRLDELVHTVRGREFSEAHVDALIELFALAGIPVYGAPSDIIAYLPVEGTRSPLELLRWQVRQMAMELSARTGQLGSDLDGLIEPQEGAPPPSFLLAGYVAAAETTGGEIARRLMGKKNWRKAPEHRYPAAVLALCSSDLAVDSAAAAGISPASGHLLASMAAPAAAIEACSMVAAYTEQVVNALFTALKVDTPASGVGKVLASIWNFLVDLAQTGVEFVLDVLTDAVLGTIKAIAGMIGVGSLVLSSLKAWSVSLQPDPAETRFGIDAEAVQGEIRALAGNGGLGEWPGELVSCASLGGIDLPDLTPGGAKITWALGESPIDLVQVADQPGLLDADARATLIYLTNNESSEIAQGEPKAGLLKVTATVQRPDLEQLKNAVADITFAAIPGIVAKVLVPILGGSVKNLLSGLVALAAIQSSTTVTVIYHEKAPTPTPEPTSEPTPASGGSGCPFGDWVVTNFAEYAEGVAKSAGAEVDYVPAGGSTTMSFSKQDGFTWVFDDYSVVGHMTLEGMGELNVLLTINGAASGTIEIEQNAIHITKTSSGFSMRLQSSVDGVEVGDQEADKNLFGLVKGATMTYTCIATGMAIEQSGVESTMPLYLEPA